MIYCWFRNKVWLLYQIYPIWKPFLRHRSRLPISPPLQILNSEVQTMLLVFGYWFNSNIVVSWYIFFCNFMILELKNNRLHLLKTERKIGSSVISFKMFFLLLLFQAFPDQAQPESHQLLHYCQHGPSPKGKEKPRCQEAKLHPSTSMVDDQLLQVRNRVMALHSFQYVFDAFCGMGPSI